MDRISGFLNMVENDPQAAQEAVFFSTEKSQGKVIGNIAEMDKAIAAWIETHQKEYNVLCDYLAEIPKTDDTEDAQYKLAQKMMKLWDSQRTMTANQLKGWDKLFDKNAGSRFFQRADFKQGNVQSAEMELVKKCQTGGVYRKEVDALVEKYNSLGAKIESMANRCREERFRMKGLNTLARLYNYSVRNLGATIRGSMNRGVLRLDSSKPFPMTAEIEKKAGEATESFSAFLSNLYPAIDF